MRGCLTRSWQIVWRQGARCGAQRAPRREVDLGLRILSLAREIEGGIEVVLGDGEPTDEELWTMWNDLSNPTWPERVRRDPKIEREPHGRSSRSPKSTGKDTLQGA